MHILISWIFIPFLKHKSSTLGSRFRFIRLSISRGKKQHKKQRNVTNHNHRQWTSYIVLSIIHTLSEGIERICAKMIPVRCHLATVVIKITEILNRISAGRTLNFNRHVSNMRNKTGRQLNIMYNGYRVLYIPLADSRVFITTSLSRGGNASYL